MAVTRLYWRDTGTAPNWDLSETQGTAATVNVTTLNSDTYAAVGTWRLTVNAEITGTSFPTSFVITARGNSDVRIRVSRANSGGTIQASSAWGTGRITTGTFTETFTLSTTWAAGDQLVIEMGGRRAPSTHGTSTATIGVNRAGTYVDADKDAPPVTGSAAMSGSGDVAGTGVTKSFASTAPSGSGLVAAAALVLAFAVAALSGSGDVAATGSAFDPVTLVYGEASLAGEGLLGATGDPYVPVVSVDAPDAWWRFTETSGTAAADEVGTNDLTVTGANLNVTGATHTGSAISFDGTDDEAVSGSSLGWTGAHSLTVEAWLKVSSWVTPTVTPDSVFLLWVNTSGNLAFQVRDVGKTTWAVASATAPSTGAWHHVVGVWDRAAQRALLYLNGSLANESAAQSFTDIGALSEVVQVATDGGTVFTAVQMDELAIYNEALSSTRIAAHYEAGSGLSLSPTGEADLAGEGDVAGAGLVEAFGASALDGSADLAASGLAIGLGAGALDGSGDVAATGLVEALAQGALDGAGTLDGAGLAKALGASAPSGDGVISASGTTESFAAADLSGEGALVGSGITESYGVSDLLGEGTITADGDGISIGTSALDGSGDIAGSAFTESFAAAALSGEGNLVGASSAIFVGEAALAGAGDIAGSAFAESFGAADLDGAGNLYGSAGDVQSGEGALVGEGLLVGDGLTLSYAEAAISGEGVVGASGLAIGLGVADLNGSGDIAATGEAESLAAADLTGAGDLYGASSTGPVQGAANLDGSSSVVADAIATAYGAIVCNLPVVTFNSEEVQFGADLITFGGTTCRYIYGVGDLAATSVVIEGAYGPMVGEGNLTASGTTTAFGAADLAGEGRLQGAQVGAATPCYISLESGDNVLLEDGYKLESEVPSCSTGTAALSGSGEITGLGYPVFYGTVAFDGSGLIDATSLDIVQGTSAINGSGDIAADGETLSIAAASLSGEGHLYAASQGHGVGVAALTGEGIISGELIQQATRCTISLETGFTVRLEDGSRLLAEPDSCAKAAITGEGLLDGAGGAVAYGEAALAGQGRFGAYGEDSSWGSAALTGEGRFGAYGGDNHLGLINFTGEGILNRCNAILAEDGDSVLLEDAGRIVTVCLARPITVYFVSADLVGEGILDAYAKGTGVLYYFLKRNLMLEGRLYYLRGDRLLAENSELILGMTLEGSNWVFGKLEEI